MPESKEAQQKHQLDLGPFADVEIDPTNNKYVAMTTKRLSKAFRTARDSKVAETLQDIAKKVQKIKELEAVRYSIAQAAAAEAASGAAVNS